METLVLAIGLLVPPASSSSGAGGVVLDSGNKPVAGTLVVLVARDDTDKKEAKYVTRTDVQGHFAFPAWRDDGRMWHVLAYKAGLALGGAVLRDPNAQLWAFGEPEMSPQDLKIRLLQPSKTSVRVLGPDGNAPDARIQVMLTSFGMTREGPDASTRSLDFYTRVPTVLAEQLCLTPDGGIMLLDCLAPHSSVTLEFHTPSLGKQVAEYLSLKPDGQQTVQLQPLGTIVGQFVADDPKAVRGRKLQITTRPTSHAVQSPGADSLMRTGGQATATTDGLGRFEVKEIAAGEAAIRFDSGNDQRWLPRENPVTIQVKPAVSTEVKIKLARAVPVRGRAVDRNSGQGIAGVTFWVHGGVALVSDSKGEIRTYALPGRMDYSLNIPLPWLVPMSSYHSAQVPAGAASFDLPTIKLTKAVPLEGIVVDEQDHPVCGARITAVWRKIEGQASTLGSDAAYAGANGHFLLQRVPGGVDLHLSARTEERATPELVRVAAGQRTPVRLTVLKDAAVAFEGRVLDQDGRPVAGAWLQFRKTIQIPGGGMYGQTVVSFGEKPVRSDADGRYRTPHGVPRSDSYALVVGAPGMVSYESKYITPLRDGKPFRWPDAILRRQRSVAGVVVDQEGKPVRGAKVFSHGTESGVQAKTQTGGSGKFTLTNLHPDARLVFVQKEGYRASGDQIRPGHDLRITLEAENAPPSAPLRSIRRPPAEDVKLLKDLVSPLLANDAGNDYLLQEALIRMAPLDRTFTLKHLERLRNSRNRVGVLVALGSVDDALEDAALVKDPYSRAFEHLSITDTARAVPRKRQIIAEALLDARTIEKPEYRVYILADVALRLLKLGDRAAAQKILNDGKALASQLAPSQWSGFARGHFAEVQALLDPDAGLELVKALKGDDRNRHAGNIAHQLAAVRPAEAERALKLLKNELYLTPYAVRVCYRMAPVDLPRARRIADAIGSENDPLRTAASQVQAYGAMAMALAPKDPATARALLRQAFQKLDSPEHHNWYSWQNVGEVAAMLLGYSETIDPAQTRVYFWRTLAMHPGPQVQSWSENRDKEAHENAAQLALLLALYGQFPELQKELLEPVFRHWSNYTNRNDLDFYRQNAVFTAMALADPQRTIAWHTGFYPKLSKDDRRLYPQPWMTIADVLRSEGRALHDHIIGQVYHYWVIDKEDL